MHDRKFIVKERYQFSHISQRRIVFLFLFNKSTSNKHARQARQHNKTLCKLNVEAKGASVSAKCQWEDIF